MHIEQVEFNTIITFLGMLCATVQGVTGYYAAYYRKRAVLLKTNSALSEVHRAFGNFATTLYLLGLFAGINGLVGALTSNEPPLELNSASFNIHTWGSFPVFFVVIWKLYLSYFNKRKLYGKQKWMGIAMFAAWAYTWVTAAVSYYLRTLPSNPQHPPPVFLLPYEWVWLQIILPFVLGGAIGALVVRRAAILERKAEERKKGRLH